MSALASPATTPKPRLASLDLFRGLAVFFMFDAHITDAIFPLSAHSTALERWHYLTFGLPAPGFLLAAGISFGMSVYSRWNNFRSWTPTVKNRVLRLTEVLLAGYLLHVSASSLSATLRASEAQIRRLVGWDILQCIGYMSLLLLVVAVAAPRRERFSQATAGLLFFVAMATPWLWQLRYTDASGARVSIAGMPWWMTTSYSKQLGSTFPIFPYAAFLFAGALWGCGYVAAAERGGEKGFLRRTLVRGTAALAACIVLAQIPLPAPYDDFWGGSPLYLLLRIALLFAILGALYYLEAMLVPRLRFLLLFSRESLVIYFVHLLIVYGSPLNRIWNFREMFRGDADGLTWVLLYAGLVLAMIGLGKAWSRLKAALDERFDHLQWCAAALAALVFVLR